MCWVVRVPVCGLCISQVVSKELLEHMVTEVSAEALEDDLNYSRAFLVVAKSHQVLGSILFKFFDTRFRQGLQKRFNKVVRVREVV